MPDFVFLEAADDRPHVLLSFICLGGEPRRIVRAFENVAKKMSPEEKAILLAYWAQHPPAPKIIVENLPILHVVLNGKTDLALGENVDGKCLVMRFAGLATVKMAPDLLETLIAHELAHAVLRTEALLDRLPSEEQAAYDAARSDADSMTAWTEKFADARTRNGMMIMIAQNYGDGRRSTRSRRDSFSQGQTPAFPLFLWY
jgi:hypothetical protein